MYVHVVFWKMNMQVLSQQFFQIYQSYLAKEEYNCVLIGIGFDFFIPNKTEKSFRPIGWAIKYLGLWGCPQIRAA